jgi:plastocyanin
MSRAFSVLGLVASAAVLVVPTAQADERIQAGPSTRYTTPSVTMDQGERLTFQNLDVVGHDVTATQRAGPTAGRCFAPRSSAAGRRSSWRAPST